MATPSGDVMAHLAFLLSRFRLRQQDAAKRLLTFEAGRGSHLFPEIAEHATGSQFGIRPEAQDKLNALIGGRAQYGRRLEEAQEPSFGASFSNTSGWFPMNSTRSGQLPDETGKYRPLASPRKTSPKGSPRTQEEWDELNREYQPIKTGQGSQHLMDSNEILAPQSWFNSFEEFVRALANADLLPLYRGSTEAWMSGKERPGTFLEFPNRETGWPGLGPSTGRPE